MSFQRVYQSGLKKPQTPENTSQFAPRPFTVQKKKAPAMPSTQKDIDNQAFEQDKFEATGLEIKHKHGVITPVEQERLEVLQAKMNDFWIQRMQQGSGLNYNFANIPLRRPDTSAPAQMLQLSANDINLQKKGDETKGLQTVKNLPTSESLTSDFQSQNLMGGTKPWRRGKANPELQKVFNALNAYHGYLESDPFIGPEDFNADLQVEFLQQALMLIVEQVNRYCAKHANGKKTPKIKKLESLATELRKKVFIVGADPQYLGQEWKQVLFQSSVLQEVEQEVVAEIDSEEEVEEGTDTSTDSSDLEDQEQKPDASPDEINEMSGSSEFFEPADSVNNEGSDGFSEALSASQKYDMKEGNLPQESFAEDKFGNIAKIEPSKSTKATPSLKEESEGKVSNPQLAENINLEEDFPAPSGKAKYLDVMALPLKIERFYVTEKDSYFIIAEEGNIELDNKYLNLQNEYKEYRGLIEQFSLRGGRAIDYFTKNPDALEGYLSKEAFPHLDKLDKYCDDYLTGLKQLEPNILRRVKKQNRELRKKIQITRKHIQENLKAKIPEEKQAAISYVKTSVDKNAKELQKRLEYKNKFTKDKKAIKTAIKDLDPQLAKAIKQTNKGLKTDGEVTRTTGNLSGAYLVPDGFFKPLSQSPGRESQGLRQGYQAIREVLAYELSKYINGIFKQIESQQNIGIAKTSFAALRSEEFAFGGQVWNKKMMAKNKNLHKELPEAEMPEQIGIWQERLDIEKSYQFASDEQKQDDSEKMRSQVQQVAFFDLMTGNYDRHLENLVFDKAGNLLPVDQGEILPNFDLYVNHNRQNDINNFDGIKLNKNNANQQLIWSDMKASEAPFSRDFQTLADMIDPDEVITFLKQKTDAISQAIGMPELTEDAISEESWQIMHLHIVALKEGINLGLSPKELAQIFAKSTNGREIGELYQTFVDLYKNSGTNKQDSQTSSELTPEEFEKAKENVLKAIQNGEKRLRSRKTS